MAEYDIRVVNGQKVQGRMNLLLSLAGRDLGESVLGRVTQGSFSTSVGASAGTHSGGGAVDLSTTGWGGNRVWQVLTALRRRGLIAWYRTPAQGPWPYHIHGIDRGARDLSTAARQQVLDFDRGMNGLASKGPDDGPKVPVPSFNYAAGLQEWEDDMFTDEDRKVLQSLRDAMFDGGTDTPRGMSLLDLARGQYPVVRGDDLVPTIQEIADSKTLLLSLVGEIAGLRAALASAGLDPDAVGQAVREAVADAVGNLRIVTTEE